MLRVVIDRVKEIEEESKIKLSLDLDISNYDSSQSYKYSQTFSTISLNNKNQKEKLESNILKYFDESQAQLNKLEDGRGYDVIRNPDISNNFERSSILRLIILEEEAIKRVKHRIVQQELKQQNTPNSSGLITNSLSHQSDDGSDERDLKLKNYDRDIVKCQRNFTPNNIKERPQNETISLFSKVSKIDSSHKGI